MPSPELAALISALPAQTIPEQLFPLEEMAERRRQMDEMMRDLYHYSGMPPLLLQVGERELLLDDTRRVAAKARAAGVDTNLEVYEGAVHLWHWFGPAVPESVAAVDSIARFARRHLAP
jgi:acetyl esterase/lipase